MVHPARLPLAGYPQVWELTNEDTIETVVADYREQIAASNEIMGSFDLDAPCARSDKVNENLRWVAVHMIEETARHAGHADIIRKTITALVGADTSHGRNPPNVA
ncbi:MAG: DUF664 domain-containing protein [Ilumatobacteraceae bacterium]